jgi:hypothetical protein
VAYESGTLIDNGFESGTDGSALASPWAVDGSPQNAEYDTAWAAVGTKSAWVKGPTGAAYGDVHTPLALTANSSELRFWARCDTANELRRMGDNLDTAAARVWFLRFNSTGTLDIHTARTKTGYTTGNFTAVGTYSAGTWMQYRLVFNFTGNTYKFYQRAALGDAWTPLKASGAADYDIPFATATTVSTTTDIRIRPFQNADMWIDDVRYSNTGITDSYPGASCDAHGRVWIPYGPNAASAELHRASTSGGTYTQVPTAGVGVLTKDGVLHLVDRRPSYGMPAIALGSTGYYKPKLGGTFGDVLSAVADIDHAAIVTEQAAITLTDAQDMAIFPNGYDDTPYYPGWTLFSWVSAYHFAGSATMLAYVNAEWDYMLTKTDSGTGCFKPGSTFTFDHIMRSPWYAYQASRLLRLDGQTALADEMLAQAEDWFLAAFAYSYGGTGSFNNPDTSKTATLNKHAIYTTSTIDAGFVSNQELFGMSLGALLCADPASSQTLSTVPHPSTYPGHTWDAILKRSVDHGWWAQKADGTMPHTDNLGERSDTGYHFASMFSLLVMQTALGTDWYTRLNDVLTAGVQPFNDDWATDPYLYAYTDPYILWNDYGPVELDDRDVLLDAMGVTNAIEGFADLGHLWADNGRMGLYVMDTGNVYSSTASAGGRNAYIADEGDRVLLTALEFPPHDPTSLVATFDTDHVDLTWTQPDPTTATNIQRAVDWAGTDPAEGDWAACTDSPTGADATTFTDHHLPGSWSKMRYRGDSANANGDSAWVESNTLTNTSYRPVRGLLGIGIGV